MRRHGIRNMNWRADVMIMADFAFPNPWKKPLIITSEVVKKVIAKICSADTPILRNSGSVVNSSNVCAGKSITIMLPKQRPLT